MEFQLHLTWDLMVKYTRNEIRLSDSFPCNMNECAYTVAVATLSKQTPTFYEYTHYF